MAISSQPRRLMTAEEFIRLPSTEGKLELVRGEVVEMAPVVDQHGFTAVEFAARMREIARREQNGRGMVEVSYRLARNPDTVRAPDVSFVTFQRKHELGGSFIEGPPDIAVEVLSASDTAAEVRQKTREYLDAGTRLIWIADPKRKQVTVHYPDGRVRVLRASDTLTGDDVLPGFETPVAELFIG